MKTTQVFTLYTLNPPRQWRAGFAGRNRDPFYFDCAQCGAKAPEIAGFIGTGPTFDEVASMRGDGPFLRKAMFCRACTDTLLAKQTAVPSSLPPQGCGKPMHVIGTNGGTMPCGAMLTRFGKTAPEYCCDDCAR